MKVVKQIATHILTILIVIVLGATPSSMAVLGQNRDATNQTVKEKRGEDQEVSRQERQQRFLQKSNVLSQLMSQFMSGGGKDTVTFDAQAARNAGFDEKSIELAEEMAAHTNLLLSTANKSSDLESVNIAGIKIDSGQFPAVAEYFRDAAQVNTDGAQEQTSPPGEQSKENSLQELKNPSASIYLRDPYEAAYQNCGCWWNPLPTRQANWLTHQSNNPSQTLSSWGYHDTWNIFGGGWTRAQTHKWWICGWSTFRDHAYTLNDGRTIKEQNYNGFSPRGEPNPEVYRSGPWPFPLWPSYVNWWHQSGPGR